jgi:hypothetical protein
VAVIKALRDEGIEMRLLVNDFRAGLAAQELGVAGAVTVETLLDVDAVAERGDGLVLDTPEELSRRLEQYADRFHPLFVVSETNERVSHYGEIVLKPSCVGEAHCIETPIVDREYLDASADKEGRPLFIFGDADYDKVLLSHRGLFEGLGMDLLLGYYFFVKYEGELANLFHELHEPESYMELVKSRQKILSASAQSALEARAAGAEVAYIGLKEAPDALKEQMQRYDINIIDGNHKEKLIEWIDAPSASKKSGGFTDIVYKSLIKALNL